MICNSIWTQETCSFRDAPHTALWIVNGKGRCLYRNALAEQKKLSALFPLREHNGLLLFRTGAYTGVPAIQKTTLARGGLGPRCPGQLSADGQRRTPARPSSRQPTQRRSNRQRTCCPVGACPPREQQRICCRCQAVRLTPAALRLVDALQGLMLRPRAMSGGRCPCPRPR